MLRALPASRFAKLCNNGMFLASLRFLAALAERGRRQYTLLEGHRRNLQAHGGFFAVCQPAKF
ncbi:hypothetical protein IYY11_18050 [Methylocystis sp. H62]|jgi:hypothetical protein|uniref:hypothetical protein n=1 Tax=Methylocystis sp. H62 TaxID=2785789 RepID=UPI0018C227EF|nr:hypothetical protein [Methylocystis sp. H62]MBG0795260.1 hypothetical protein [Methylocystis sp. H62]